MFKSNLKVLAIAAAAVLLSGSAVFAATATSSVNVRSGPGLHFRIVDRLHRGESVNITGERRGWCRVSKRGPDGWVLCQFLAEGPRFRRGLPPPPPMFVPPPRPPVYMPHRPRFRGYR
jgi:uncharacterized protein YraI